MKNRTGIIFQLIGPESDEFMGRARQTSSSQIDVLDRIMKALDQFWIKKRLGASIVTFKMTRRKMLGFFRILKVNFLCKHSRKVAECIARFIKIETGFFNAMQPHRSGFAPSGIQIEGEDRGHMFTC